MNRPDSCQAVSTGWSPSQLAAWMSPHLAAVESALSGWVGVSAPAELGDAMRYAVLEGGKRLRPLLVLAAAEAVASQATPALRQQFPEAALYPPARSN